MSNILLLALCLAASMLLRGTGRLPEGGAAPINAVIINVALPALTQLQALRLDPALLPPPATSGALVLCGGLAARPQRPWTRQAAFHPLRPRSPRRQALL